MSLLSIVIVNYCTEPDVMACLASLAAPESGRQDAKVIVVDNQSPDGSGARIDASIAQNGWSSWACVLAATKNGGFAFGNNLGIRQAMAAVPRPELFLLLNPDTIVQPGAISALIDFMAGHPDVGICGARLDWADGTSQWAARRFPSLGSELADGLRFRLIHRMLRPWLIAAPDRETLHATDWVVGAAMMVRGQVIDEIGLLDEDYFLYFEEVDFCLRARRAGWPCWYVPQARIFHATGRSTGVIGIARRPRYWFESRARYFQKNHGGVIRRLADVIWSGSYLVGRALAAIAGRTWNDPPRYWRDFVRYNFRGSYKS